MTFKFPTVPQNKTNYRFSTVDKSNTFHVLRFDDDRLTIGLGIVTMQRNKRSRRVPESRLTK